MENRQKFYRIAYSYVKNEQEALEIVSDAMYKGLVYLKDLREMDYFITWMTRIIINTSLETLRKKSKLTQYEDYMAEVKVEETGQDQNLDLYHAINMLDPDEKSYVILKYFEERTYREMSDILEMPQSTIKSKIYRSLEKMKSYLEGGNK
ncbi:sigma-70 family RNA polymerase sigma factor [Clostridium butyricum]|uniref:sigma-70 family RNA polymerase sigma factor n=1 Tax=Clostridium butyricum TaxID=1492 RepID=UPI001E61A663|nr:sigma-70 family RNA polymerase sigma factor [Clostridium butyricum]